MIAAPPPPLHPQNMSNITTTNTTCHRQQHPAALFPTWTRCLSNNPWVDHSSFSLPTRAPPPGELAAHHAWLLNATRLYRSLGPHRHAGYKGPWIENHWVRSFCCEEPLETFGGLVPIFVLWTDLMLRNRVRYAESEFEAILALLRPDVLYVTVSQSDEGLYPWPQRGLQARTINVLVLSAGGYGHVPLPLIKGEQGLVEPRAPPFPVTLGFAGTANLMREAWARDDLPKCRAHLKSAVREAARRLNSSYTERGVKAGEPAGLLNPDAVLQGANVSVYHGPEWRAFMADTMLNLAPRGYGRSSFRLTEAIQMGRVPVYVYDDMEWLPYRGSPASVASSIGYSVRFDEFLHWCGSSVADVLRRQDTSAYQRKLRRLLSVRDSHYTYAGVVQHIRLFLCDPLSSDLRCERHPVHSKGFDLGSPERYANEMA